MSAINPAHPVAIDSGSFGWRVRNGVALLGHAASALQQLFALVLALLFGALAWLALATIDKPERMSVALFLAGLAVAAPWGFWFSRLVALHAEARQARMPFVDSAVGAALALAALATAGVPGLLLALGGVPAGVAVCAMVLAACAGMLMATLPRIFYLLLCFAPLTIGLAVQLLEIWAPGLEWSLPWRPGLDDIGWLVPPALAITAWRWRAVVNTAGEAAASLWWQPMVMGKPGQATGSNWLAGGASGAHMPDWMWPAGQTAGAGPANPVRAMRALLGTPFAPLSAPQILIQLGIGVVAFAYLALGALGDEGDIGTLVGGALGGLGVMVVMYGQRLETMFRKRSAELDELALLPAFGSAERRRATFLRAVSWAPSWAIGVLTVLLVAMGATLGMDIHGLVLMLMALVGMALVTAIACLRPMAGLRLDGWRMLLLAGPGLLLAMVTMLHASRASGFGTMAQVLAALWVLGYVPGGMAFVSTLRRFRARPHPFLQE